MSSGSALFLHSEPLYARLVLLDLSLERMDEVVVWLQSCSVEHSAVNLPLRLIRLCEGENEVYEK